MVKDLTNCEHTAISIKVVHEQSGKVKYERERLLGIANKINEFSKRFLAAFRARIRLFRPARAWTTLIEVAV
jgi:hypothetical protein